jgi:hypothetical protein
VETALTPKHAVIFKTHAWDDFVVRQFERYRAAIGQGDLYIIADETNGPIGEIPHDRVIRTCNAELLALGLADAFAKGGLLWWNTDYPNYLFYDLHRDYDYYMFVEYDTCMNLDIDAFLAAIANQECDFVSLPTRQPKQNWYWTKFHQTVYNYDEMHSSLNCISLYSNRAMQRLLDRRREMAKAYQAKQFKLWPGNEVFIATEIARAGYRTASLEDFGDATHYEWHPPILEEDLPNHSRATFLHPVLDRDRYIESVLKFEFDLSSYFVASSPLRRRLSRFPMRSYLPRLPRAFRRQVLVKLRQSLGGI